MGTSILKDSYDMIDYFGTQFLVDWEYTQLTEKIFRAVYTKNRTTVAVYVDELDMIQVVVDYRDELGHTMQDLSVQFTGSMRKGAAINFLYSVMIKI